jgi:hypothetical protein
MLSSASSAWYNAPPSLLIRKARDIFYPKMKIRGRGDVGEVHTHCEPSIYSITPNSKL